ncbi:hypothetical protein AAZX31_U034100 [Glycine max]
MDEYFPFVIAESLLGKLASSDVQSIKDTLSIVKGVLFDAEEKKDHKHGLREWRKQVVKMKVGHFFSSSNSLVFRLKMARQIKHVRRRLDKIADDGNKFGLERIDVNRTLVQRRDLTYSYFDASWVIGRDNDNDEIIKLLMQPHPHGDGDGDKSLGKTTLAKLVYNDQRIDELFQLKMWINIKIINSDSATALALTSAPCHQENVSSLGIEQLQSRLRYNFSGKKYLLVLDDIWNDDRRKWIELKDLIKVGAMGSKIIATTRRKSIASMMRVPLAVQTLGSSLLSNFDLERWEFVREHEDMELRTREKRHFTGPYFVNLWGSLELLRSPGGGASSSKLPTCNIPEQVRHLSVVGNASLSRALFPKSRSVRTILFPIDGEGADNEDLLITSVTRFKCLRILDLSDSCFETLPHSIAILEHLLPHSICKIQNLQLLSLRGFMEPETLPKGLAMLIGLRKLFITTKQSILAEDEFASLTNLHTLSFCCCDNLKFLFRGSQFSSLEVLYVQSCGNLESLLLHILPKPEALLVMRCEKLNLSLGYAMSKARDTLQTLFILNCDNLKMLPEWLTTITHLKMLQIVNCPQLLNLPSGMHRLMSTLEDLSINGCPELCPKMCATMW